MHPCLKKSDKTVCSNYRGIIWIDVYVKISYLLLLNRLTALHYRRTHSNPGKFWRTKKTPQLPAATCNLLLWFSRRFWLSHSLVLVWGNRSWWQPCEAHYNPSSLLSVDCRTRANVRQGIFWIRSLSQGETELLASPGLVQLCYPLGTEQRDDQLYTPQDEPSNICLRSSLWMMLLCSVLPIYHSVGSPSNRSEW